METSWSSRRPRARRGRTLPRLSASEQRRAILGRSMIRLELLGAHTRVHATLCARCPQGPTGCCAGPPGVEWSDVGRIVSLGGVDWLLAQIASGALRPGARGLLLARVARRDAGAWPERCVYHGPEGCTIPPDRRAST